MFKNPVNNNKKGLFMSHVSDQTFSCINVCVLQKKTFTFIFFLSDLFLIQNKHLKWLHYHLLSNNNKLGDRTEMSHIHPSIYCNSLSTSVKMLMGLKINGCHGDLTVGFGGAAPGSGTGEGETFHRSWIHNRTSYHSP